MEVYEGDRDYIFVCYSRKDSATVLPIVSSLQDRGFRIWFDLGLGVETGAKWRARITERIDSCRAFLLFMSENANSSEECAEEILEARAEKKSILPVYLEDVELNHAIKMVLRQLQDVKRRKFDADEAFVDSIAKARFLQCCRDTPSIDFKVGELYGFGSYPFEGERTIRPMIWICISKEPGKALLLSKYGLSALSPISMDAKGRCPEWELSNLNEQVSLGSYSWSFTNQDREWMVEQPFLLDEGKAQGLVRNVETRAAAECRPTRHALRRGVSVNSDGTCNWWVKASPTHHPSAVAFPFDEDALTQEGSNSLPAIRPAVWVKDHAAQTNEPPFYHGKDFDVFAQLLDLINLSDNAMTDLRKLLPKSICNKPDFVRRETYREFYEGQWVNGNPHGVGWQSYSQKNQYLGNWFEGRREGDGMAMYPDGSIYVGQWADDYFSEPGTFFSATDGRAYRLDGNGFVNGDRWFYIDNADA